MAAQFGALAAMAHAQTEPSAAPPAQANTTTEPAKVEKVIVTDARLHRLQLVSICKRGGRASW